MKGPKITTNSDLSGTYSIKDNIQLIFIDFFNKRGFLLNHYTTKDMILDFKISIFVATAGTSRGRPQSMDMEY